MSLRNPELNIKLYNLLGSVEAKLDFCVIISFLLGVDLT